MGMLCNVIDGSNVDNDMIQFISDMNDCYIFSLLTHILVYKFHNLSFVMYDHVSAYPDVYLSPKIKLN